MAKNKVRFGLKKCFYALVSETENEQTGVINISFGKPVPMPGAVSLSLSPEGEVSNFYADDRVYYTTSSNAGYSGDFELALIPESFLTDVLKEKKDANGVLMENKEVEPAHFALLFEFTGDQKKIRHDMYYCSAARPSIEGSTVEDKNEVATETLELTVSPLPDCVIGDVAFPDGLVKSKTGADTTDAVFNGWYNGVYVPTPETPAVTTPETDETQPVDQTEPAADGTETTGY